MKRLVGYLSPYGWRITLGTIIKFIGTVMDLFLPWILSYIIDEVIVKKAVGEILLWGALMIFCSIIAVAFNIIANRMASYVSGQCTEKIRLDLFKKSMELDAAGVDRITISSLESRLTVDTYNIHGMLGMVQRLGIRAPILVFGGVTVTFLLDAKLTLVLLATMPLIGATVFIISRKGIKLYAILQSAIDSLTAVVRENISGVRVIKAICMSGHEKERFDGVNTDAIKKEKSAVIMMATTNPIITFFLNAGLCAILIYGAYLVYRGESTSGKIIAFMSYFTIISNAVINFSRIFTGISKGLAGMERISAILDTETKKFVPTGETKEAGDYAIEFRNVTFSYGKRTVLKDISFALPIGQTLGIIGATGSGKSTVASLIMRIYETKVGEVLVYGRDVREYDDEEFKQKFGIVFQNDFLFADTVAENVLFGREADKAELWGALSAAQAESFIRAYSDKENHMLDIKGANLSGGQKQRLLVARALLKEPEILILDDSSSALDYRTDAAMRSAIAKKMAGKTKVIIAQRVSAIKDADLILVLEEGRIIGRGTHGQLMENCPEYAAIANSQMGGEICDD